MKKNYLLLLAVIFVTQSIAVAQNTSLSQVSTAKLPAITDTMVVRCAKRTAQLLMDTSRYDRHQGIRLERLFTPHELKYLAAQGLNETVYLFKLVNENLPANMRVVFLTDEDRTVVTDNNPLILRSLRATIAKGPSQIFQSQWKENIYQAYMARHYGTNLFNTITLTAALREIREKPDLEIIDHDNQTVSLRQLRARNGSEQKAVADLRMHTIPGPGISTTSAAENYRRALFALIDLQLNDIRKHPQSQQLLNEMANDLRKGTRSNILIALQSSHLFDANVPNNQGLVLLTESDVMADSVIAANARDKATELMILTCLHYGERDAVKLFGQLVKGNGAVPAGVQTFGKDRLRQLTDHGTEQFKYLNVTPEKMDKITNADLVILATASPEVPEQVSQNAYLSTQVTVPEVGRSIVNTYNTNTTTTAVILNPAISLSSRHIEYRAADDPIDFVPEMQNGQYFDQRGSRVTQNGIELRLTSDLYFSNPLKMMKRGVKPVIYPEFGLIAGIGTRDVGQDQSTTIGPLGPVPQFSSMYYNWGTHLGLNIGPFMFGIDGTILSTTVADNPQERFFDLSQGMTYYRYQLLTHILNLGSSKKDTHFTIDLDLAGETNNEGFGNLASTQGTDSQIQSARWYEDYNRVHPAGGYDAALAKDLLNNGYVKASYTSSNYAALDAGIQLSGWKLTVTGGLYNLHTRTGYQVYDNLISNTWHGNFFGAVGLAYRFQPKRYDHTETKKQSTSTKGEEVNITNNTSTVPGLRDHAIFTNQRKK